MWVHKSWFLEFYRVPLIHFVCTLVIILTVIASEETILMVRVHQRRYFIFPESAYSKSLLNSTVGGSWWNMVDPIHYGYTAEPPVSQHREDARIINNSLIEGINTALAFCMIIQVIPVFVPTRRCPISDAVTRFTAIERLYSEVDHPVNHLWNISGTLMDYSGPDPLYSTPDPLCSTHDPPWSTNKIRKFRSSLETKIER